MKFKLEEETNPLFRGRLQKKIFLELTLDEAEKLVSSMESSLHDRVSSSQSQDEADMTNFSEIEENVVKGIGASKRAYELCEIFISCGIRVSPEVLEWVLDIDRISLQCFVIFGGVLSSGDLIMYRGYFGGYLVSYDFGVEEDEELISRLNNKLRKKFGKYQPLEKEER